MSKPLKETKVGRWLKDKAPKILNTVGDVLPDKGVLGIVKNLISSDPEIPAEQKLEFEKMVQDFEKEMYALEIQDRSNARTAEVDRLKSGSKNVTQNALAYIGVVAFFLLSYYIISKGMASMTAEQSYIVGSLTGLAGAIAKDIYGYYFGSSKGSADKTHELSKR